MRVPASVHKAATSSADASPNCLFPNLEKGVIEPTGNGENLWQTHEPTKQRWINLCGLWVGNTSELFDWCPLNKCTGRAIVAEYLRATKTRIVDKFGFGDLASLLRGAAYELAYDSKFDLFRLSGGALDEASIEIHPSLLYRGDVPAGEETIEPWVIVGEGPSFEEWKARTAGFWEEQDILTALWTAAREGWIELTGRWPNATSERRSLAPDFFYSDGNLTSGTTQLRIGDSTIWGAEMRVNPNLALVGMFDNGTPATKRLISKRAVKDATLKQFLQDFLRDKKTKATRDEVELALGESYTITSLRESYSRQPMSLIRRRGEKR